MTAFAAAEELHRLAAMAAPIGIFIIDDSPRTTFVNPRVCEIIGAPEEEILANGLQPYIHPSQRDEALARLHRRLADGSSGVSDYRLHRAGDAEAWIRVWSSPLVRDDGRISGFVGVMEDVTRQRHAEAQARALEQKLLQTQRLESLGLLAGGIAHDFNNLLQGIVGNVTLAQLDVPAESEAAAALADCRLAAERATDLTAQLLAYAGRGTIAAKPVDLTVAITETRTLLRSALPAHVSVTLELAPQLPLVKGDATRLRQVVMNLLTNASDALGDTAGRITVRTGVQRVDEARKNALTVDGGIASGDHVLLEVADTGCGMSPETLARIFDPFFTTKRKGRGLGLAATIGTLRAHHGGLEVQSEPGRGTTFRLLLPVDPSQPVAASAPAALVPQLDTQGSVLVVDDDSAVRAVTRRLLTRQGFEVLEAADGVQGVERLREAGDRIRCVLLDLTMPGIDGRETFRRMREVDPAVRVVIVSGQAEGTLADRFDGSGVAGVLLKPFDLTALLRATKAAIEG